MKAKTFLEDFCNEIAFLVNNDKKIFVAYSGGLDSHVLLHLLHTKCLGVQLTAIHINHNLSPNSAIWAAHCEKICDDLGVEYLEVNVDAKIIVKDHSPEEIARKLRYDAFAKILSKDDYLLTAHQANDQAETLLLQLFRGAGPKGLSAIAKKTKFASGYLLRPLLNFPREALLRYATENKLKWIEDESNTDTKFDRNFIRHEVIPLIKKKWPGIIATLNRVAGHCREASEALDDLASEDLMKVCGKVKNTINIGELKKIDSARQHNVLRFWLHTLGLSTPSAAKLNEVVYSVIGAREDAMPVVLWNGAEIRRFCGSLYAFLPLPVHDNKVVLSFDNNCRLKLPSNLGDLMLVPPRGSEIDLKKVTVRFRVGGEKLKLPKRGTHDLKKLMQEWEIPPWLRDRIPLIYYGEKIVGVVGYFNDGTIEVYTTPV